MSKLNILSIQSHVAYGHVGNASATFPMQRLGVEVWPIHTVQFSNHTGYGAWKGQVFDSGLISELVEGIAERGVLGRCDAVLSGYMGSRDTGEAIIDAVARVKAANPAAVYACDPVIGDTGRGIFVRPGIPEFMRDQAVPAAEIIANHLMGIYELAAIHLGENPPNGTIRPDIDACVDGSFDGPSALRELEAAAGAGPAGPRSCGE